MNGEVFFQTSLIAAFLGGMVALFAPCCISFLLPAYLGSVFKERSKILLMTLVFSLGIFIVLLPVVLGTYALSSFFLKFHTYVYTIGALVMLAIGAISFLGIKLPIPMVHFEQRGKYTDVLSIFTLGIMSGITTSCCAPVLIGILTLSFLSPTFYQALLVGAFYVLGMVFPLYLSSFFITEKRILNFSFFRKKWFSLKLFGSEYPILTSNILAGSIFTLTGLITLNLVFTTGVAMSGQMDVFTKMIQTAIKATDDAIRLIPAGQFILSWVTVFFALGFVTIALTKDLMGREWSLRTWLINNKNIVFAGFISCILLSFFYFLFIKS